MEELLTENEIVKILEEARKPEYQEDYLFSLTSDKLHIFKVSKKGLIFIHGDNHTGMEHIQLRHSITSRKLFEKDGSFDNPTKFNLAPVEYSFVADSIYVPENLNSEKNVRPEMFDLYIGDFKQRDGKVFSYRLILYRSTKIVHTFFLTNSSKPFNKKINLPVRQGWSSGKWDTMSGLQTFSINYLDLANIVRFTIFLRCIPKIRKERWYLIVNDHFGTPTFTHYLHEEDMKNIIDTPFRMEILDFQDLSAIDKKIKNIIKGTYEFEKNFSLYSEYKYQ
ncbi:hypothetical protein [Pedobacter nyackensis]|uniref:hypothetical protein n=1 Tax=Pedobacter nyackensis TaxID=475255 RepID=UPI00292FBEA5|nr:hypothetical protein [Pedobacter nyackensis]